MEKKGTDTQLLKLSTLYNPFLLKNMDEALKRIVKAVNLREKIIVYGCYDLDGITAVSVLFLVLKYLNADVEYYVSDSKNGKFDIDEGIVRNHVKFLGTNLMITVGCGINSYQQVELCKQLGIDVIITDYHRCNKYIPETIVINPNQKGCGYPFKKLSSVGVVYKLAQAISSYYQMKCISKYLDLVMLGAVSNDVLYIGENKLMIDEGIYHMNYTNNYGLQALIKVNNIRHVNRENAYRLAKSIVPSRTRSRSLDNARIAVELFTTSNSDRAQQIAKYLKNEIMMSKFCVK
ncbi:DHH family phosphoesterase [Clostridium rectalis]|uniref:DHH family phosphoesterase n=1 Tax=Clostridium rectalis TaxID=2040295 RepID=UPI000F63F963|nr:DHH family phosphoesterase [Clostridium rectalis]